MTRKLVEQDETDTTVISIGLFFRYLINTVFKVTMQRYYYKVLWILFTILKDNERYYVESKDSKNKQGSVKQDKAGVYIKSVRSDTKWSI